MWYCTEFWFCTQKKKKDMPRGSRVKAYQKSKPGGNGQMMEYLVLQMPGSPCERSALLPPPLALLFSAGSRAQGALLPGKRTPENPSNTPPPNLCHSAC